MSNIDICINLRPIYIYTIHLHTSVYIICDSPGPLRESFLIICTSSIDHLKTTSRKQQWIHGEYAIHSIFPNEIWKDARIWKNLPPSIRLYMSFFSNQRKTNRWQGPYWWKSLKQTKQIPSIPRWNWTHRGGSNSLQSFVQQAGGSTSREILPPWKHQQRFEKHGRHFEVPGVSWRFLTV